MFSDVALLYVKVGNLLDTGSSWLKVEFFTPRTVEDWKQT